jgi:putative Mn2+ efflux pump MntP
MNLFLSITIAASAAVPLTVATVASFPDAAPRIHLQRLSAVANASVFALTGMFLALTAHAGYPRVTNDLMPGLLVILGLYSLSEIYAPSGARVLQAPQSNEQLFRGLATRGDAFASGAVLGILDLSPATVVIVLFSACPTVWIALRLISGNRRLKERDLRTVGASALTVVGGVLGLASLASA